MHISKIYYSIRGMFMKITYIKNNICSLKNIQYDLQNKQLLKLSETRNSKYSTQALRFKVSLIWKMVLNKLKTLTILRILRNTLKTGNLLPAVVNCVFNYMLI